MRPIALPAALLALRVAAQDNGVLDAPLEGVDDGTNYYQQLHPCPQACDGTPSSNWMMYSSWERFAICEEPMLLSFALFNPVLDPGTPTKITTCTAGNANSRVNGLYNGTAAGRASPPPDTFRTHRRSGGLLKRQSPTGCEEASARSSAVENKVSLQLATTGTDHELDSKRSGAAATALKTLQNHFDSGDSPCEETVMFSYHQGVVAGVYIGASFGRATVASVAKPLLDQIASGKATTAAAQLCGAPDRTGRHTFGLIIDLAANVTAVQNAVRSWSQAKCATGFESTTELKDVSVTEDKAGLGPFDDVLKTNGTFSNNTAPSSGLSRRADCKTIRVEAGDSCPSLASRCGISSADFARYNSNPSDICSSESSPLPGMSVCCSSGELPRVMRIMAADGTCAAHQVKEGDICDNLARQYNVKVSDIEKWNQGQTWGWYGCNKLIKDAYICVGEGSPPMPAKQKGAVCGPTKENATGPDPGKALKDMYPCPLNACCNVWGQCGISGDFCTEKNSTSGNPGTSGLQNGCVSSCGMEITNVDKPSSFGRIGYYETWNFNRKCLWQHVENANTDGTYTIIHWAFAEINTKDWTVKITDPYKQWDKFKEFDLGGAKKVISFGGWGYSTEPGTYDILRQATLPANRNTFATNVAKFLKDEDLDGADFDWEYPSNTDIPGAEGKPEDTGNYYKFLQIMRDKLSGTGRSLSIAAPASFWYLKPFPIKQMAEVLDYIVFMTYDLHGQWDAGNQYAIDGCPAGNCVRSHVNLTETTYTLAMITKAGVKTSKIYVGESSYARTFKLSQPGCRGPMCTFLGDRLNSPAAKGRCTDTGGYISNAEINELIDGKTTSIVTWHDADSNSDMIIHGFTEWGAYMTPTTKNTRREHWTGAGFRGTIDWAVDLQAFTGDEIRDPEMEDNDANEGLPEKLSKCKDGPFESIEHVTAYPPGVIPTHCVPVYIAEVLARDIKKAMDDYDDLMEDGYNKKFNTYADAVAKGGNSAVRSFMYENGNKYFSCTVKQPTTCCKACLAYNPGKDDEECRYCDDKYCGGWSVGCSNLPRPPSTCKTETTWFDASPECPPDYSKRAGKEPATGYKQSIDWKLKEDKRALFWADLFTSVGIEEKNIKWQDVKRQECLLPREDETCRNMNYDWNFPVTQDYDKDDVLNPKDVVEKAYKELQGFVSDMPKAVEQMQDNVYSGSAFDFVDAVSMPIFMVQEAVGAIKEISDTVDKWEEDKRKNTILLFLSAIFFFVPVLGQLAGAIASLANVARIIAMIGAAGTLALDIYSVVDSEGNDPLAIFGLVLAPLAIFDAVAVARAASRARNMNQLEIKKLGKGVVGKVGTIKKVTAPFCTIKPSKRSVFPVGALPMSGALNVNPFGSLSL
ncbi:hypothetical protein RB594_004724 [Gaeumannomyces avenae]